MCNETRNIFPILLALSTILSCGKTAEPEPIIPNGHYVGVLKEVQHGTAFHPEDSIVTMLDMSFEVLNNSIWFTDDYEDNLEIEIVQFEDHFIIPPQNFPKHSPYKVPTIEGEGMFSANSVSVKYDYIYYRPTGGPVDVDVFGTLKKQ